MYNLTSFNVGDKLSNYQRYKAKFGDFLFVTSFPVDGKEISSKKLESQLGVPLTLQNNVLNETIRIWNCSNLSSLNTHKYHFQILLKSLVLKLQ